MERLVELTCEAPRRIFGLPEQPDTWVEWTQKPAAGCSAGRCTPGAAGRPSRLAGAGAGAEGVLRGRVVMEDGQIRAEPGLSRVVSPI